MKSTARKQIPEASALTPDQATEQVPDPFLKFAITTGTIGGIAAALAIAVIADDAAIEAVRDLTEPHAVAAATLTFVLALTPLWLTGAYLAYRALRHQARVSIPVIVTIVASGVVSLLFLGPKRSSGEGAYERKVAEHGGSVANAIAMAGDAASFVAVAVFPVLILTALVSHLRKTEPSDRRFGQIVVSVLVILALAVLVLVMTSPDLGDPLVPERRH